MLFVVDPPVSRQRPSIVEFLNQEEKMFTISKHSITYTHYTHPQIHLEQIYCHASLLNARVNNADYLKLNDHIILCSV